MTYNYDFMDNAVVIAQDYSSENSEIQKLHDVDELGRALKKYIDSHICTIEKLSSLSEIFSYNYCYLSCLFKKVNGITLSSYYKQRRLTEGRKLLEQGVGVGDVAEILNYSSAFSFSKAYKSYWGVSPKKHKK